MKQVFKHLRYPFEGNEVLMQEIGGKSLDTLSVMSKCIYSLWKFPLVLSSLDKDCIEGISKQPALKIV